MRAARSRRCPLVLALCLAAAATPAFAQVTPYVPKHSILSWKTVIFGGAFRVLPVIPLHGDFSKYNRLEIVRPESVIGPDVPASLLTRLGNGLVAEFSRGRRFEAIDVVDTFAPASATGLSTSRSFRDADALDAPMRTWADLQAFDRQREASNRDTGTIVIRSEVIDYAKGNKLLQLLMVDLGNAVLTIRFSYYDKVTGEELGRTVISSDNSSKIVPSLFSTRSPLSGVAEGLVDQLTRRKVASERCP